MILAIDPGNTHSGYVWIEEYSKRPVKAGKVLNSEVLGLIEELPFNHLRIEMIASYGMAVGKEVFETCVWIGRFIQKFEDVMDGPVNDQILVYRKDVKLHHCNTTKAKDSNIIQALIDRFASGEPNRGKGTKKEPGWFYGFNADIWQAYALAVYAADELEE